MLGTALSLVRSIHRGRAQFQASKGRVSSWSGTHPARVSVQLSWNPQTPHSAVPAVPQLPSRCRPPHLPPGRGSRASLPGGGPRSIPTFRNRPGGDLAGLIKRARRFFLRYPGPGASGARPHPGPADSAGLPQGNLLSACPASFLPPPAPLPASVSPAESGRSAEEPWGEMMQLPETPARKSLDAEQGDP